MCLAVTAAGGHQQPNNSQPASSIYSFEYLKSSKLPSPPEKASPQSFCACLLCPFNRLPMSNDRKTKGHPYTPLLLTWPCSYQPIDLLVRQQSSKAAAAMQREIDWASTLSPKLFIG